jgi:hypothetical protein
MHVGLEAAHLVHPVRYRVYFALYHLLVEAEVNQYGSMVVKGKSVFLLLIELECYQRSVLGSRWEELAIVCLYVCDEGFVVVKHWLVKVNRLEVNF